MGSQHAAHRAWPDGIGLAYDGITLGELGEPGEAAFADDKKRMSESIRKRDAAPGHRAAKGRFDEG